MSEANVKFIFEGREMMIQCKKEEKMREICQRYSIKLGINKNLLIFLYGGIQINSELSFESQANIIDKGKKEMNVLVIKNENDELICPKCGEKIKLNKEKIDEIILGNNEIKDSINGIKLNIENIIKTSSNELINFQLKNINKMLSLAYDDLKKNIEKIKNLLNESLTNNEIKKPFILSQINDNEIKIKIGTQKIDKTLDLKYSKSFLIDNINIKNIGNKSFKNLYLIKDNMNSSREINFLTDSKIIDKFELSLNGELKPNDTYNAIAHLNIINAKPEQIYKMIIYVREKGHDRNISEPLEINIKIKKILNKKD